MFLVCSGSIFIDCLKLADLLFLQESKSLNNNKLPNACIQNIREWKRVEIDSQETEVASVMATQFMEDSHYRIVVQRTKEKDSTPDLFGDRYPQKRHLPVYPNPLKLSLHHAASSLLQKNRRRDVVCH